MYLTIPRSPPGTVGIVASGAVTGRDRRETLEPSIARALATGGPLRLLYVVGSDFRGYDHGGPYEPAIFGRGHFTHFFRIAFLAVEGRYTRAVLLMDGLMPAAIRVFGLADLDVATRWLATGRLADTRHRRDAPAVDPSARMTADVLA